MIDEQNLPAYAHDHISVSTAQFGAFHFYDPDHVRSVTALDGSPEVLITLDATHSILLEHALAYQTPFDTLIFH